MAVVYRHIRLDKNEVFYIGIGSDMKRPYIKVNRSIYWNRIIRKTDYRVDILFDDLTWEEACEKEKEFIQLYGRRDLGLGTLVNLTDGGEGMFGYTMSDTTKEKISKSNKGKLGRKGYKHSKESIEKMVSSKIDHIVSDETRKKMSNSQKGKKISDETKEKMRISNSVPRGPWSDERKLRYREIMKHKRKTNTNRDEFGRFISKEKLNELLK